MWASDGIIEMLTQPKYLNIYRGLGFKPPLRAWPDLLDLAKPDGVVGADLGVGLPLQAPSSSRAIASFFYCMSLRKSSSIFLLYMSTESINNCNLTLLEVHLRCISPNALRKR